MENTTYLNEVSRVPAGSKLIFYYPDGQVKIDQYYKYEYKPSQSLDINTIAENYKDILQHNIKNYLDNNNFKTVGISLTGGFDSRMILALLDDLKISPKAYHYGHEKSDDFKITKKLCQNYNLDNDIIEWRDLNFFKSNTEAILGDSDFMLPLHHCHMYESIFRQKNQVDTVFYGHFMDMQMQSHFYNKKFDTNNSQKEVSASLKEMWCGGASAFSVLSMDAFQDIFSKDIVEQYKLNIELMIEKYSYLTSDKQYEISYLLNHGTRRAIAQCQLGSKHLDYHIPALKKDIFEFIWNIDTKFKKKRSFQKLVFKKFFKKSANLDFVMDNYKIINLRNESMIKKRMYQFKDLLKHPRIKILKPYFDFWGKEYEKFDNYKSWMIEKILENQNLFDDKLIKKEIFLRLENKQSEFPFAFISTFFTISQFLIFFKKHN